MSQHIPTPPTAAPAGHFLLCELACDLGIRPNHVRQTGVGLLLRERLGHNPPRVRFKTPWIVAGERIWTVRAWPDSLRPYAVWLLTAPMRDIPLPTAWRATPHQPPQEHRKPAPGPVVYVRRRSPSRGSNAHV